MRILGIDYGSKRVGIAISDQEGKFAIPHSVIINKSSLIKEIEKIAKENNTKQIIIGESRNYKSEPNAILYPSQGLKKNLKNLGFAVYFEPEFMTSVQAERIQGKNDMTDASAAALILQSYLDRNIKEESGIKNN